MAELIMGLDMYAFSVERTNQKDGYRTEADYQPPTDNQGELIFKWRKHSALHQWMQDLYYEAGGQDDTFNCVNLALSKLVLLELEDDLRSQQVESSMGSHYFGELTEEEVANDLEFVRIALEHIDNGKLVYYSCWW